MADKTVVSFNKPTPEWATWVFRIIFVLTTGASVWIAATGLIDAQNKVEIILVMKILDFVVWGIGKGLGVEKSQFEDTQN